MGTLVASTSPEAGAQTLQCQRRVVGLSRGGELSVYRQRTTAADEVLLRVVFPWLASARVAPLRYLARIWSEPVDRSEHAGRNGLADLWNKLTA